MIKHGKLEKNIEEKLKTDIDVCMRVSSRDIPLVTCWGITKDKESITPIKNF